MQSSLPVKHPQSFFRLTVKAIIKDSSGNILAVKENSTAWDLPGGGVHHGENEEQALRRELEEELEYSGDFTYTLPLELFDIRRSCTKLYLDTTI